MGQRITPFLWFEKQATEAARFYVSIFKGSKILLTSPMTTWFRLASQEFMALNSGAMSRSKPALSLFIRCKTQREVDYYWRKLSAGGKVERCGWLTDRYGLSWQVVPEALGKLLQGSDRERSERVMQAMLAMTKLDIAALKRAASAPSTGATRGSTHSRTHSHARKHGRGRERSLTRSRGGRRGGSASG